MNKFVVNKNSWHYRFLRFMGNTEWDMSKVYDFCSYWRKFIFTSILAIFIVLFVGLILSLILAALIINPVKTIITIVAVASIIGVVFLVIGGAIFASKKTKEALYSESLIGTKYKSWKAKYCPMIEYKE